jgi:hypothetical protein
MHPSPIIADPCRNGTLFVDMEIPFDPELPPPHDGDFSALASQPSLLFLGPSLPCSVADPHQSEKPEPDQHPSQKTDPDLHQSQNSEAMKAKNGAMEGRGRS